MSKLILLTDEFPLNNGETFLETEIKYYEGFDKVYIIPLVFSDSKRIRKIGNHELIKINCSQYQILLYCILALFKKDTYKEFLLLKKNKQLTYENIKHLFRYYTKTLIFTNKISKLIHIEENDIIYSYWMTNGAHIAIKLKEKYHNQIISRCHRYDLYEENTNYIPFRQETLMNIDLISPISNQGKDYLLKKYSYLTAYSSKIMVNYLGSEFQQFKPLNIDQQINILSCSNMIPVKRIDKIIHVLKSVSNVKINWYHIGDGELKKDISNLCLTLPSNVSYQLLGKFNNEDVLHFYMNNDIHLFINTSDSEGIPVSIMEAMSFGTPIIATDVGGVKEIINNQCGLLVSKDFNYGDVAKYIEYIFNLDYTKYNQIRKNAYNHWLSKFNAETNYEKFNKLLLNMGRRI